MAAYPNNCIQQIHKSLLLLFPILSYTLRNIFTRIGRLLIINWGEQSLVPRRFFLKKSIFHAPLNDIVLYYIILACLQLSSDKLNNALQNTNRKSFEFCKKKTLKSVHSLYISSLCKSALVPSISLLFHVEFNIMHQTN